MTNYIGNACKLHQWTEFKREIRKSCQELLTVKASDIFTQHLYNKMDNSCKLKLAGSAKTIK